MLHITVSISQFLNILAGKNVEKVPLRKYFWKLIIIKMPGFAFSAQYIIKKKKFTRPDSAEAILVPALAQTGQT